MRGNASLASRTIVRPKTSSVQIISPIPGLIRKLPLEASTCVEDADGLGGEVCERAEHLPRR